MEKHLPLGWHNLHDEMMLFRSALIQFITEPTRVSCERAKEEAVSLKTAIEAVIELPEDEVQHGN